MVRAVLSTDGARAEGATTRIPIVPAIRAGVFHLAHRGLPVVAVQAQQCVGDLGPDGAGVLHRHLLGYVPALHRHLHVPAGASDADEGACFRPVSLEFLLPGEDAW